MMLNENVIKHQRNDSSHIKIDSKKIFGFWIYLMNDCIVFAILFASYVIMVDSTAGGPKGKDIFNLPFVLIETGILLFSSITYGMAVVSMKSGSKCRVINWLILTFFLGISFISLENYEFYHLINDGFGPNRSGFLSGFFTLVGTHGLHVLSGIVWMLVLIIQIYKRGLSSVNCTRIMCLSLFWHFLDIIWVCVFTIVYLIGAI